MERQIFLELCGKVGLLRAFLWEGGSVGLGLVRCCVLFLVIWLKCFGD